MMYTNSFDECYNLSLAYRIYTNGSLVLANFPNSVGEHIDTFNTEKQAIDFIHWVAQEMNK